MQPGLALGPTAGPRSLSLDQWLLWNPPRGLSPGVLEDVGVAAMCPAALVWAGAALPMEKEVGVDGIPPGWHWGVVGMKVEGKTERAPCAWKWTLEKRSGQRTLPLLPGSELTPSTTSAPPEPTLLESKGVPGGSHSHAEPSPWCSCCPGLLVLQGRDKLSAAHRARALHTDLGHLEGCWLHLETHLGTSVCWGSPMGPGRGASTPVLSVVEPREPHGMFCTWPSPRFNMSHLDLHQHRGLFKERPAHSNQPAG